MGVAADLEGNAYLVGQTDGRLGQVLEGRKDCFVQRYDTDLNPAWVTQFGSPNEESAAVGATCRDPDPRHIYVFGWTKGPIRGRPMKGTGQHVFISKVDRGLSGDTTPTAMAINKAADALYITGYTFNPGTNAFDAFIIRCDTANLAERYRKTLGSPIVGETRGYAIALRDQLGYIAGSTTHEPLLGQPKIGKKDGFVAAFVQDDGEVSLLRRFGSREKETQIFGIVQTDLRVLYVAGDTTGSLPGQNITGLKDAFLLTVDIDTFDTRTTVQWGENGTVTSAKDVAGIGPVYITGSTNGTFGTALKGTHDLMISEPCPVTSSPSASPTSAAPSSTPTGTPSATPTTTPTNAPSLTPLTRSPETRLPSMAPQTSSPSRSPATRLPSQSPTSSVQAPIPLQAQFGDAVRSIVVGFSWKTDRPEGGVHCRNLVSSSSSPFVSVRDLFGSGTANKSLTCKWRTGTELEIQLGARFEAEVGTNITVLGRAIYDSTRTLPSPATRLSILAPAKPTPVTAILTGPSKVAECDNLTLDASQSLGRAGKQFSFDWGYVPLPTTSSSVAQRLRSLAAANRNSSALDFPSIADLDGGLNNFSLTVTNWLGAADTSYFVVERLLVAIPRVQSFSQAVIRTKREQQLVIRTRVSPPCGAEDSSSLRFINRGTWTQLFRGSPLLSPSQSGYSSQLSDHAVAIRDRNSFYLTLAENSLKSGHVYGFSLLAQSYSANGVLLGQLTSTYIVVVEDAPIFARISGGDSRKVPVLEGASTLLSFDGSPSYDPSNNSFPLRYNWSLTHPNETTAPLQETPSARHRRISIASSSLQDNSTYIVKLTVFGQPASTTGSQRFRTFSQKIVTQNVPIPTMKLKSNVPGSKFDAGSILRLKASSENYAIQDLDLTWSVEPSQNLDLSSSDVLRSEPNSPSLALSAGSLSPGVQYSFTISGASRRGLVGSATTFVVVNSPPSLGTCFSTPTAGIALKDKFFLKCVGWVDEDLPLRYAFFMETKLSGRATRVSVSGLQDLNSYSTFLPAPESGGPSTGGGVSNESVSITAQIEDSLKSSSYFEFRVWVSNEEKSLSESLSRINVSLSQGDTQSFKLLVLDTAKDLKSNVVNSTQEIRASRAQLLDIIQVDKLESVDAAQLIEAATDFGAAQELQANVRKSAVSKISDIVGRAESRAAAASGSFGDDGAETVSTSSLTDADALELAQASIGALDNVFVANRLDAVDFTDEDRVEITNAAETVLNGLSSLILQTAVSGEERTDVTADTIQFSTQLKPATSANASNLTTTSGASLIIPGALTLPQRDVPLRIAVTHTVDALYPLEATAASGLVIVEVYQNRTKISQAPSPFVLHIPVNSSKIASALSSASNGGLLSSTGPSPSSSHNYTCRYWSKSEAKWKINGVRKRSEGAARVECESDHLTAFNTKAEVRVSLNTFSEEDITIAAFSWRNPVMVILSFVMAGFAFVTCCTILYDYKLAAAHGVKSSDNFWKQQNKMRFLRLSKGRNSRTCKRLSQWGLRRRHPWFSIFVRHPGDYMTSTKRLMTLMIMMFNGLTVCALMLDQEQQLPLLDATFSAAVVAFVLAYPIPATLDTLQRRVIPKRLRIKISGSENTSGFCNYLTLILGFLCGELELDDFEVEEGEEDEEENKDQKKGAENGSHCNKEDSKSNQVVSKAKEKDNGGEISQLNQADRNSGGYSVTLTSESLPGMASTGIWPKSNAALMSQNELKKRRTMHDNVESSSKKTLFSDEQAVGTQQMNCLCCNFVRDADMDKISNHDWVWKDFFATVFAYIVALGCWFILVVLFWKMRSSATPWISATFLSFVQDFVIRIMQIIFLDSIMFFPCFAVICCCCCCCCYDAEPVPTDAEDVHSGFYSDIMFRIDVAKIRLVRGVLQIDAKTLRAEGVRTGLRIRAVHVDGLKIEWNDSEMLKLHWNRIRCTEEHADVSFR
eukprot:jgi/Bigna1/90949/estExt_fgenesh1_pg.C_830080